MRGEAPGASARPSREGHEDDEPATRILVVDDAPWMRSLLRDALAEEGYEPVVTGDHPELARIFREERPALAVLDVVLPDADGLELMHEVPALSDLPVILISGHGRDETVAQALDAGAADYIVEPFSPTESAAARPPRSSGLKRWSTSRRAEGPRTSHSGDVCCGEESSQFCRFVTRANICVF